MADNRLMRKVTLQTEKGRKIRRVLANPRAAKRSWAPIGVDLLLKLLGISVSWQIPPPPFTKTGEEAPLFLLLVLKKDGEIFGLMKAPHKRLCAGTRVCKIGRKGACPVWLARTREEKQSILLTSHGPWYANELRRIAVASTRQRNDVRLACNGCGNGDTHFEQRSPGHPIILTRRRGQTFAWQED